MRTMKIWRNILVMTAAMLSLASCSSDDNVERRLSNTQKETYGQNISGSYPGQYVITYKDKDCKEWTDEEGRHHNEFFQDFPVSLISKVVDANKELSDALAEVSLQAITARYDLGLDTDYNHIVWAFTPNVMSLHLYYGGADHHIRIEFNNNSQYYKSTADELKQSSSFLSFAKTGVALQLKAIYDGSIQRFGAVEGNYMHIFFDAE